MQTVALGLAIALNACAHLLIKAASSSVPAEGVLSFAFVFRPTLVLGGLCFVLSLAAYTYALTAISVSVAYPILMAVALLIITAGGLVLFGERLTWVQGAGSVLIMLGAYLLVGKVGSA
jgi:multidrug transporter EmrE-like cation transporter